ncbi:MAG: hypothetical protein D6706_11255 [Chloroflexi bacterium]|nr:MAG: hypothetical protein D6706_11255 [Chloroflexota bacterium]
MCKQRLLIAVAYKDGMNGRTLARCIELVGKMIGNEHNRELFDMDVAIHRNVPGKAPSHAGRFWYHAVAREELIFDYLKDEHDYILWVDADIVSAPPDLPALLYDANPDGVTAPLVLIEGTPQFYDTLGFIEDGARTRPFPPYFDGPVTDGLVDLDSVGCIYLAPADVVRQESYGSRPYDPKYDHPSIAQTGHTDHWPVMCAAADEGYRIACLTTAVAYHADLSEEGWH